MKLFKFLKHKMRISEHDDVLHGKVKDAIEVIKKFLINLWFILFLPPINIIFNFDFSIYMVLI